MSHNSDIIFYYKYFHFFRQMAKIEYKRRTVKHGCPSFVSVCVNLYIVDLYINQIYGMGNQDRVQYHKNYDRIVLYVHTLNKMLYNSDRYRKT